MSDPAAGKRLHDNAFLRLYRGQTRINFVGRRRIWFATSLVIILIGMAALGFRGVNLGIDFKGGASWQVSATSFNQSAALSEMDHLGVPSPVVFVLGASNTKTLTVEADLNSLSVGAQHALSVKVINALAALADPSHPNPNNVSVSTVGPTWGGQVTQKALEALIAFFVAVVIYIAIRFEPKMSLAALVAVLHDLLVTVGVYAIFGFQITPDTVVAILTILGYSLYDTVVVFDRVRDNARGVLTGGELSYSDMVNLSMNQTLARSINTSAVAIIPVLSVLLVGAELLGATTLQDYGLALFVGLTSGAYSSIFIASPLLAVLKEREPRYIELRNRVHARSARAVLTPAAAALLGSDGVAAMSTSGGATVTSSGPLSPAAARAMAANRARPTSVTPRPRKQKRR